MINTHFTNFQPLFERSFPTDVRITFLLLDYDNQGLGAWSRRIWKGSGSWFPVTHDDENLKHRWWWGQRKEVGSRFRKASNWAVDNGFRIRVSWGQHTSKTRYLANTKGRYFGIPFTECVWAECFICIISLHYFHNCLQQYFQPINDIKLFSIIAIQNCRASQTALYIQNLTWWLGKKKKCQPFWVAPF